MTSNSLIDAHSSLSEPRSDVTYSMTFVNKSNNSWNFCCYQKDPNILKQGALPAAWFVKQQVHPTTTVSFKWNIAYGLTWSRSGTISPGIIYNASQNWPVTPTNNKVTLTKPGSSYTFKNQEGAPPTGVYQIQQDSTVVSQDGVGVGISMQVSGDGGSGGLSPIYAQNAQPSVLTQFSVTPRYWVVFSENIQPSQILNVTNMTNTVEVPYAPGVYSNVVTLDQQNQWHVATTGAANRSFLLSANQASANGMSPELRA